MTSVTCLTYPPREDAIKPEAANGLPNYLPRWIWSRGAQPLAFSEERTEGILMMADISGFTKLGEELSRQGAEGTELFSRIVDSVFALVDDEVHRWGGDTLRYVGDAPVVFWRLGDDPERTAAQAIACGMAILERVGAHVTPGGRKVGVKVGLASGEVLLTLVGGVQGRWEALAAGRGFEGLALALDDSRSGQVTVTPNIASLISATYELEPTRNWHAHVVRAIAAPEAPEASVVAPPEDLGHLAALVPDSVLERLRLGQTGWIGEHRRVTTLFLRVGALEWTTRRAGTRLHQVTRAVQEVVYGLDGEIPSFAVDDKGTVFVAVWGLPSVTHEDDPSRALIAAIRLADRLESLEVTASIGVTTGRCFCGERGGQYRREYGVMGATMNLAARLMSRADGDIFCDRATVEGSTNRRISFTAHPSLQVRGRDLPVEVFTPALTLQSTRRARVHSVGRREERDFLRGILEDRERGHRVVIEGEAGIGKSTLVDALLATAEEQGVSVAIAEADSIERLTPFFALRGIFSELLGVSGLEGSERAEAVARALEQRPDIADLAPLLNVPLQVHLAETERTQAIQGSARAEHTQRMAVALLRELDEPVVIVEDAQWLDSASWGLVWVLVRDHPEITVLLVTRPQHAEHAVEYDRILALEETHHLRLQPLSRAALESLIADVFHVKDVPDQLVQVVEERSEGNPFYAQQLSLALQTARLVEVHGDALKVSPRLREGARQSLPDTLEGVVAARLDQLSASEQLCLKTAAVVGRAFEARLVREVYPVATERDSVEAALEHALEQGLTTELPAPRTLSYLFQHAITRDIAYGLLLFEQRRALHRAVASWYENTLSDLGPLLPLLAHHWLLSDSPKEAVDALEAAAGQAVRNYANREVITFLEQAIDLVERGEVEPVSNDRRAQWERWLGEAHSRLGDYVAAPRHLKHAAALLGAPVPSSVLSVGLSLMRESLVQLWRRWVRAPTPARARSRYTLLANVYEEVGLASYFAGDLPVMLLCYVRSLNLAELGGQTPDLARTQAGIGVVFSSIPLTATADAYVRASQELANETGDAYSIAVSNHYAGGVQLGRGELSAAAEFLEPALTGYHETGNARRTEEVLSCLLFVAVGQGEYRDYQRYLERLRESARVRDDQQVPLWVAALELEVAWRRGQVQQARVIIESLDLDGFTDEILLRRWHGLVVHTHILAGDLDAAIAADAELGKLSRAATFFESCAYTAKVDLALALHEAGRGELSAAKKALKGLQSMAGIFPFSKAFCQYYAAELAKAGKHRAAAREAAETCLATANAHGERYVARLAHKLLGELTENPASDAHLAEAARLYDELEASFRAASPMERT